jgi:hypothetical protein
VILNGGDGPDTIIGGDGADSISGGNDDDYLQTVDGVKDAVDGGLGTHDVRLHRRQGHAGDRPRAQRRRGRRHAAGDAADPAGHDQRAPGAQLDPSQGLARAAQRRPAAVRHANRRIGKVAAKASGLKGHGAVMVSAGSRVSHHGKTVTARLALKLPRSVRGQSLRVAVQATDRHGRTQLEADAGVINVAK